MRVYLKDLTIEEIIKRLKDGEIIVNELNGDECMMIDGVICSRLNNGSVLINDSISRDDFKFFKTKECFMITETGLYKTRDGRKVLVSNIYDPEEITYKVLGLIEGDSDTTTWTVEGWFESDSNESKDDIVAKWDD